MTALRRKTKIRGRPMQALDLNVICDKCNTSRAHGNHTKCSKQRQAEAAARNAQARKGNE